ncbi:MAG: hypothetical protein JRG75_13220 [Deltaproteobacteria bacterium]|nr:hypothetical protein [Deltaproteobacteria bacterium]
MVEKQSEIGQDAQLAMLLQHKWQTEIDKAVDKVKMGVMSASSYSQWIRTPDQ